MKDGRGVKLTVSVFNDQKGKEEIYTKVITTTVEFIKGCVHLELIDLCPITMKIQNIFYEHCKELEVFLSPCGPNTESIWRWFDHDHSWKKTS